MPEMNGFDVLTAMNNNRQIEDIPVVMISAENGIEHIERAYDLAYRLYQPPVRPHGRAPPRGQRADTGRQAEAADAACRRADL